MSVWTKTLILIYEYNWNPMDDLSLGSTERTNSLSSIVHVKTCYACMHACMHLMVAGTGKRLALWNSKQFLPQPTIIWFNFKSWRNFATHKIRTSGNVSNILSVRCGLKQLQQLLSRSVCLFVCLIVVFQNKVCTSSYEGSSYLFCCWLEMFARV